MLQALGRYIVVEPTPDTVELGNFTYSIRGKVNKGKLISKGSGVTSKVAEGDTVHYRAGLHRMVDGLYLMEIKSVVAYERAN